ncbi:MAG: DUF2268 domain-containing putative Zn-dependent protease [Longimicrobiales bacterium]
MRLRRAILLAATFCAIALLDARAQAPRVSAHPDSARLITSDIMLFWRLLDQTAAESLAVVFDREYLRNGSDGLRDFIPGRILGGPQLAQMVINRRARYDSARSATLRVAEAEREIRNVFRRLKELYPAAVFPDVYFVIGRLNSGGTVSSRGLLIGAEMYRDPAAYSTIVAHELIHYQQPPGGQAARTLLGASYREGSADFIAQLIATGDINAQAQAYGREHERALWDEFKLRLDSVSTGWLYGNPPPGRPSDLGYFIGYRIAEAYYDRAADKAQAVRDIIMMTDYKRMLEQSGYNGQGPPARK